MFKLGLEMLANDLKSALALSGQIIQQYPKNIGPRLARIETLLKMKQDKDAKAEVDAILAKTPNLAAGIYYKALLMARANDVNGAWKLAQSLPPEFAQSEPTIAIMMSQMAIESGNVETGAAILTSSLARSPDILEVRLRLATVRLKQNSPEAALSVLSPIKDSTDPRAQALLSQVYLKLGKYTEALDVLNRLNSSSSSNAGVKRELALVKMHSGQSDQAIKDLLDLVAKQPTDPSLVGPLVAALAQNGRYAEALAAADRLGSDPKQRAQALFLRSQVLIRQHDTKGAIAALGRAIQIEPKNIASLYYRADLYESLKQYADASRDLNAIVALDGNNVSALVKLAEVDARQGQDKPVRTLLAKAISVAPKNPIPRIALVRFLIVRHDLKGAQAAASDLLKIVPNNPDGLALTGEIQLASGQKSEAVATYRTLVSLLPRSAKPQLLLANALYAAGDRVGAGVALTAAGNLEPNSGEIRAAQINLLFAQGDPDGAITAAKAYRSANPSTAADLLLADTFVRADRPELAMEVLMHSSDSKSDARLLLRLVILEAKSGDRKKAEGQLANWLKSNPNDIAARSQYATFLMQDGDKKSAVAQFEMVLRQDANNIPALNNLGWLLQKEDPKRALSLLTLAYKLGPDLPDIVDSLGWIKLQLNDPKAALPLLTRAHALRPKDGELTYHLIVALDANGNRNAAKSMLKTLLASGVKFDDLAKAQALATSWH
jgi:putative PEP-CTERM system TPR-repeat lipoprotein